MQRLRRPDTPRRPGPFSVPFSAPFGALTAGLGLLLAACGDAPAPRDPNPARSGGAAPTVEVSAEQVARAARSGLRCPAPPATEPAPGEPADDVVGVRPGQSWDEAWQRVLCSDATLVASPDGANRFRLPASDPAVRQGFSAAPAEPRVNRTGAQIMREMQADAMARAQNTARAALGPGQSRWYVGTMGLPGAERVTHVLREEWYPADATPALQTLEQALRRKYGEPTRRTGGAAAGGGRVSAVELHWVHDPAGRAVPAGDPRASPCGLHPSPDAGVNLSEACGLVVAARLQPLPTNPGLVQALQVGSVHQARGYARVTATVQALQQRDAERRAREVQDAARQTRTPTL